MKLDARFLLSAILFAVSSSIPSPASAETSPEEVKAFEAYKEKAAQGDVKSQYNLAVCFDIGKGVGKNLVEALKWYRKAAEQGDAKSQYNLAVCLSTGEGVEKDESESVKWYRMAADQGYASAQSNLGYCYYSGKGVSKNLVEALKWYRKGAEQGNVQAEYFLAHAYTYGREFGVDQDLDLAFQWNARAAAQGHVQAQIQTAQHYAYGSGVPKNEVEAYAYFNLANSHANTTFTRYENNQFQALEKKLSREEIYLAQRRSGELKKEIEAKIASKKAEK
jgi:TPR repeat protein